MAFGVNMGGPEGSARWISERRFFKRGTGTTYRKIQSIKFLLTRDLTAVASFLSARYPIDLPLARRIELLRNFIHTTNEVRGYHTLAEILTTCDRIFRRAGKRPLTVVEAGAGSGSSTAKLSLAVRITGGRLLVYDTFRGIPENEERHELLDGRPLLFRKGAFRGRLSSVQQRVEKFGAIEVCTFHKGLFEETLANFAEPVDVALLDVDLIASTRTCVRRIFPHLVPGGVILSQDGHLRATVDLLGDARFWRDEVGVEPPRVLGLGREKMLEISAPT